MHKSFAKLLTAVVAVVTLLASAPTAFAQGITTSAVNGIVVDKDGKAVAGATVTITHDPSGTKAVTTTQASGQYTMSGLRVGGPYTITVDSAGRFAPASKSEIYLDLDQAGEVNFDLSGADVVKLEKVNVSGSRDVTFDAGRMSNATSFSASEINNIPMIRRDVQDVAIQDSRLNLTPNTSTGEFQLNAPGQNFRYNSFLVDGAQNNDSFGLNGNGMSSLRSPVPMDAVQAMSIDLSPYDVRRSGFTGALINAVIKSGTNEMHGSVYGYFTNQNLRGENPLTHTKDTFNERTVGLTLGGPIIKDKLFYFITVEDFHRKAAPPTSVFLPDAATYAQVVATLKSAYGYDAGTINADQTWYQKSFLAKLDWNINSDHRLSFTYRRIDGSAPIFADLLSTSNTSATALTTNYNASGSDHWYQQPRISNTYSAQLNSNWTADFRTEATVSLQNYDGSPAPNGAPFPEIQVRAFPGTDLSTGATVNSGFVTFGTERSRQYNQIHTKTLNANVFAEYSLNKHTLTAGADYQHDNIDNKFVQYIYGQAQFTSVANFLAGITNIRQASLYGLTPAQATALGLATTPPSDYTAAETAAIWSFSNYGIYAMDTWRPTKDLTITAGLRLDTPLMPDEPIANRSRGLASSPSATLSTDYFPAAGYEWRGKPITRNTYTMDGNSTLAPRVGFNYKLPFERKTTLRGGAGVFQGRNPVVWLSNIYSNTGAASSTTITNTTFTPVTTLQTRVITQSINVIDPDFKQPVYVKANLALDHQLPWAGWTVSGYVDRSWALEAPYVVDLNLGAAPGLSTNLPDGRRRYGSTRTAAKSVFGNVLLLTDAKVGGSESYTVSVKRAMRNNWAFSASYTHGHSTDVSGMTSSVAFSNYAGRTFTEPNEAKASTSNYDTPDKFVINLARTFDFFGNKDAKTVAAVSFRGQTGHNYSWIYFNDVNGDGTSLDLVYMPTLDDVTSGKVVFGSAAQQAAFFTYAGQVGLDKYAGRIVPRNAFVSPWQSTVDLHFEQAIPISKKFSASVFLDVLNFANLINKKYGIVEGVDFPYTRGLVNAAVSADGKTYTYTFGNTPPTQIFTETSRWQVQLGARLKF